jgi:glutathione S-transferase
LFFSVRFCLAEKQLKFKWIDVNTTEGTQHQEWFKKMNPFGVIPVLVHKGVALNESTMINEYIDEVQQLRTDFVVSEQF